LVDKNAVIVKKNSSINGFCGINVGLGLGLGLA